MIDKLAEHLGSDWERRNWRFSHRNNLTIAAGPYGSEIINSNSNMPTKIKLQGEACAAAGAANLIKWLKELRATDLVLTPRRIDIAFDDYLRFYTPKQIEKKIWKKTKLPDGRSHGSWKPGVRTSARSCTRYTSSNLDQIESDSIYIGSPTGDRVLLVYDKTAQSNGVIDCIRWELRGLHGWAQEYLRKILDGDNIATVFTGLLLDYFDVKQPKSYCSKHPERQRRSRWFQRIVGTAKRANVRLSKALRNAVQIIENDKLQIARRLARIYHANNSIDVIHDLIRFGTERMTPEDHRIVVDYRAAKDRDSTIGYLPVESMESHVGESLE